MVTGSLGRILNRLFTMTEKDGNVQIALAKEHLEVHLQM